MPRGGARIRKNFVNRNRKCNCGACPLCKIRAWKHDYYLEHRERTKAKTAASYQKRKVIRAARKEASDAELDRKALEWLERNQIR